MTAPTSSFDLERSEAATGWGLADLDRDADRDLVVASRSSGGPQIVLRNDDGLVRSSIPVVPGLIQRTILVTDLDGDGRDTSAAVRSVARGIRGAM